MEAGRKEIKPEDYILSVLSLLMIAYMEPFDDRSYGATPCFQPEQ